MHMRKRTVVGLAAAVVLVAAAAAAIAIAHQRPVPELQAGEVGYLTASIKTVQDTRVGDTCLLYTSRCV